MSRFLCRLALLCFSFLLTLSTVRYPFAHLLLGTQSRTSWEPKVLPSFIQNFIYKLKYYKKVLYKTMIGRPIDIIVFL